MIMNLSSGVPTMVQKLQSSPHEYYLTGSRFFGGVTKESDCDFFVANSPDVITELLNLGFIETPVSYEEDKFNAEVFFHPPTAIEPGYHVQFIKGDLMGEKLHRQQVLKVWGKLSLFPKTYHKLLWDLAGL